MLRLVAMGLLVATLAAVGRSQSPEALAALGKAQRLGEEDIEEKARLLRRAWLLAEMIEGDRERRQLQGRVADLIREVDGRGVRTVRILSDAIEDLRDSAKAFSAKGWYDSAETMLRAAELLLPESVEEDLRELEQWRADLLRASPEPAPTPNQLLLDWFRESWAPYGEEFTVTDDGITSPGISQRQSQAFFSRRVFSGDGRLRIEVGIGNVEHAKASFAWSQTLVNDSLSYYIAELEHVKTGMILALVRIRGKEVDDLAAPLITAKCPQGFHWHTLEVILTGRGVVARVDEHGRVAAGLMERPNEGGIGFFISGDSGYKRPVQFRHLSMEGFSPVSAQ